MVIIIDCPSVVKIQSIVLIMVSQQELGNSQKLEEELIISDYSTQKTWCVCVCV